MLRSISAVVIGFILWTILWLGSNSLLSVITPGSYNEDGSTDSQLLMLVILVISVLLSLLAGYVTARIVGASTAGPVWGLGILLLAVGLFVQISFWAQFSLWYHILFLGLLIPAVMVGARFVNRSIA